MEAHREPPLVQNAISTPAFCKYSSLTNRSGVVERPEYTPESGQCLSETLGVTRLETEPAPTPVSCRFPWIQLVFCIACFSMTAWTWMRFSYALPFPPPTLGSTERRTGRIWAKRADLSGFGRLRTESTGTKSGTVTDTKTATLLLWHWAATGFRIGKTKT
jgi:hypothetical protein